MILLCTRLFGRFSHVVTSLYSWLIYWIRGPNLGKRRFIEIEFELLQTLLHLFQPNYFIFLYVGKLLWGLIRKDCIEVQKRKNKVVVLCWRFGKKRELRPHFLFAVLQWRQRNVQKIVIKCKVVFYQSKAISIAFFEFSLPLLSSSSSLLKLSFVYKRVSFVKEVNKTSKHRRLGSSSRRCCCNVQKTVMYVLSCCFANLRPCPR